MLWIVLAIVVIGGGIGIYRAVRASKSTLTLVIAEPSVARGEPLSCRITLENKRMIQCDQLLLSLVGTKQLREKVNGEARTTTKEVHRSDHIIVGTKTYSPNNKSEYAFELPTPVSDSAGRADMINASLAEGLKAAAKEKGGSRNNTQWRVDLRLDAKGGNLATSQAVSISNAND